MDQEYSEYLKSEAWHSKRQQRLKLDHYRCVACGRRNPVEVHHLTYARIFNEDMADLMSLCSPHHRAIEAFIDAGDIARVGSVVELADRTLDLLTGQRKTKVSIPEDTDIRNGIQENLMSEPWFVEALRHPRKQFRKIVRARLRWHKKRGKYLANGFVLYDRHKKSL